MAKLKPYYQDNAVTIYHGDCLEILPELESVDLVLTDPPYGINNNNDYTRFSKPPKGHGKTSTRTYSPIIGDSEFFDPSPWLKFERVILWGYNHFARHCPMGTTLVWIKRLDGAFGSFLSDAELAWMKGGHGVYCFRDLSNNRIYKIGERVHPTQKPVSLMSWCLGFVPNTQTILDPYMGSGTTLRAAKDLGRKAIGIEIEEKYCEIAARRMAQEVLELNTRNDGCLESNR